MQTQGGQPRTPKHKRKAQSAKRKAKSEKRKAGPLAQPCRGRNAGPLGHNTYSSFPMISARALMVASLRL